MLTKSLKKLAVTGAFSALILTSANIATAEIYINTDTGVTHEKIESLGIKPKERIVYQTLAPIDNPTTDPQYKAPSVSMSEGQIRTQAPSTSTQTPSGESLSLSPDADWGLNNATMSRNSESYFQSR